jgi:hypothetical protein
MALIRYSVGYAGLTAVYTSPTGLTDIRTGLTELGGGMNVGDFVDLTDAEAQSWSPNLYAGRYRFVQLSTASTAANVVQGKPCGIAAPTTVGRVAISGVGSGQTAGTYLVNSSASGGTALAVAQVVVGAAGTITSATLVNPGAGFTSTPTFTVAAGGTPGTILAQMAVSENVVSSFDASAISLNSVRGVFLGSVTAAQITAGAFVFIQEQGVATALVTTATNTTVGCTAATVTAGAITTATETTAHPIGLLGLTLDVAAASTLVRVELNLPVRQG